MTTFEKALLIILAVNVLHNFLAYGVLLDIARTIKGGNK